MVFMIVQVSTVKNVELIPISGKIQIHIAGFVDEWEPKTVTCKILGSR
jgi:hypothetical protein